MDLSDEPIFVVCCIHDTVRRLRTPALGRIGYVIFTHEIRKTQLRSSLVFHGGGFPTRKPIKNYSYDIPPGMEIPEGLTTSDLGRRGRVSGNFSY